MRDGVEGNALNDDIVKSPVAGGIALLYWAPVVSTQFVPVEAFTMRTAKLGLLSTPETPVKSTVI